ncbi:hypothetical protein CsSME_00013672 [Camellia sinensis var. sinensis]
MSPEGANLGGDGAKYLFAMEYHNNFQKLGTEFSLAAFGFLELTAHKSIPNGHIALNDIQRRHAKVSTGDTISMSR